MEKILLNYCFDMNYFKEGSGSQGRAAGFEGSVRIPTPHKRHVSSISEINGVSFHMAHSGVNFSKTYENYFRVRSRSCHLKTDGEK